MKKVLIFQGGWDGHEPKLVSNVFKQILEENGVTVDLFDNLTCLADVEKLRTYDLIVPVWTMGEIDNNYVSNISKVVSEGVGLAGAHGGMCDAFRNSTQWQFITGAQWVAHPGNDGVSYKVELKDNNLFTNGLNDFMVTSEQYYIHIDPAIKVYATTKFPVANGNHTSNGEVDMPVVFTKMWGKGKVFYNSLGHHADIFDIPEAREIMKRGLIWSMR